MLTKRKRRLLFYFSILIFLALLAPVLLYSLGYGLGPNLTLQKTGGVFIQSSESGAELLVGKKIKHTSLLSENAVIKNLVPGSYAAQLKKDEFWEWQKKLEVKSEKITIRNVLMIPKNLDGEILYEKSPETAELKLIFKKNIIYKDGDTIFFGVKKFWELSGGDNLLILGEDGKFYKNKDAFDLFGKWGTTTADVLRHQKNSFFDKSLSRIIYWDSQNIYSYWIEDLDKMPEWEKAGKTSILKIETCSDASCFMLHDARLLHVFSTTKTIRNIKQYPDWPDYLIVAMDIGIYAMEMEAAGGQNIFPLYKGKIPEIISVLEDALILKDDERFIKINLP